MPNDLQTSDFAPLLQTSQVFLTGGSGYVGRNLIRSFVANGSSVVALARSDAAAQIVTALGAKACQGDVLSTQLGEGMRGCDVLIHAAADTNHRGATLMQARTNIEGTRNVFESAGKAGIRRAIHISTESVLLDGSPLINAAENHPMPLNAVGGYSRTKAEAERIALSFQTSGYQVVVVRPRFVWGRDDTTALPYLVKAAQSGQLAFINGGHYLTSTTHIANLCEGVSLALQKGKNGEVYFITDGSPIEFRNFVTSLLETQGITAPGKEVPRWLVRTMAEVGDRLAQWSHGGIRPPVSRQELATMAVEVTLDISKARRELGYVPKISRGEGLLELQQRFDESGQMALDGFN